MSKLTYFPLLIDRWIAGVVQVTRPFIWGELVVRMEPCSACQGTGRG